MTSQVGDVWESHMGVASGTPTYGTYGTDGESGYERTNLSGRIARVRTSPCIGWTGYCDRDGYGGVRHNGKWQLAHRVAYVKAHGGIPDGMEIDHLCRNRACVNPEHLEAVTKRVNSLRSNSFAAINHRKTHCDYGHEFTPENTRLARGKRNCRACERRRAAAYNSRKKAS